MVRATPKETPMRTKKMAVSGIYPLSAQAEGAVDALIAAGPMKAGLSGPVGDLVGVACMIDSCGAFQPCKAGAGNCCGSPNNWLTAYN
jgi:hypothetical protein